MFHLLSGHLENESNIKLKVVLLLKLFLAHFNLLFARDSHSVVSPDPESSSKENSVTMFPHDQTIIININITINLHLLPHHSHVFSISRFAKVVTETSPGEENCCEDLVHVHLLIVQTRLRTGDTLMRHCSAPSSEQRQRVVIIVLRPGMMDWDDR